MAAAGNDFTGASLKSNGQLPALPPVPGEECMRHEGVKWKEAAEKRLAGRLLVVSKGQVPAAAAAILVGSAIAISRLIM